MICFIFKAHEFEMHFGSSLPYSVYIPRFIQFSIFRTSSAIFMLSICYLTEGWEARCSVFVQN
jgi:hypothetical protein